MKRVCKSIFAFVVIIMIFVCVGCNSDKKVSAEKITLENTVLNEVEFENSDKTKLESTKDGYKVVGEIESMNPAQKSVFGVEDVTHVIVIRFEFDRERTIDSFTIKGEVTKVYSTDKNDENYVGSLSSLLDNKSGEDAYCDLILSANTKEYMLISKYSDDTISEIKLSIDATLVTAKAE